MHKLFGRNMHKLFGRNVHKLFGRNMNVIAVVIRHEIQFLPVPFPVPAKGIKKS